MVGVERAQSRNNNFRVVATFLRLNLYSFGGRPGLQTQTALFIHTLLSIFAPNQQEIYHEVWSQLTETRTNEVALM